ncbi:MAG: hypothetical protein M1822_007268 [Bathelium mastoideum]|nr:MAG: hypothetical protein M1822_007268 [Bathelium mastoideum]
MDPLAAFGVAVNVIQLIDFSTKLVSGARQIHHSFHGELEEHTELKLVTDDLSKLARRLDVSIESQKAGDTLRPHENHKDILDQQKRIAIECQRLATQLLTTLNKLKGGSGSKTWNSIRQALLTAWRKDEIEALEKRLDRLRQEMVTNMVSSLQDQVQDKDFQQRTYLDRIEHNTQTIGQAFLANVENSRKWREELVETIHENGWQSLHDYGLFQASIEVSGQAQETLELQLQKKLVERLRFEEIQDRHDQVAQAHKETFRWIFEDPAKTGKPWSDFTAWLENGESLYWITGKPASGKSTLMKFVYHDSRTLELLQPWAADSELVTAAFFFWNSGSRMQKSQIGLLRSLLYQILHKNNSLVSSAFPDRWEIFKLFGDDRYEWRWAELVHALKTILSGTTDSVINCNPAKKYCLFIDGLDEFDGDASDLLHLMLELESFPCVKLCVSSRPWMVFIETFHRKPSLLLEDLTYPDIQRYVHTSFHESRAFLELEIQDPEYANTLLERICQKASGVFLWVQLVVASLINGLMQGDRASDLQRRLDEIPPDLESFFQKMLDSLDPLYRAHASQLFQIVRIAETPLTLLQLSFADVEDPKLVFRADIQPLDNMAVIGRCKIMRRRIISRCCGLLEVAGSQKSLLDNTDSEAKTAGSSIRQIDPLTAHSCASLRVEYLHRTVRDFLESAGVWDMILKQSAKSFDTYITLCRGALLELKAFDDLWTHSHPTFDDICRRCISYAQYIESNDHDEQFRLLDELDRVVIELTNHPGESGRQSRTTSQDWSPTQQMSTVVRSFVVTRDLAHYVKYRITKGGLNTQSQVIMVYLAIGSIMMGPGFANSSARDARNELRIIQMLLDHGAVTPSQQLPDSLDLSIHDWYDQLEDAASVTLWLFLLSKESAYTKNSYGQSWFDVFEAFVKSETYDDKDGRVFIIDSWARLPSIHAIAKDRLVAVLSLEEVRRRFQKARISILPSLQQRREQQTHVEIDQLKPGKRSVRKTLRKIVNRTLKSSQS